MGKRDWFIVIIPLFIVWAIDYYTKLWASHLVAPTEFWPLTFALYHNHGVILGLFLDLPKVLRVVSLSTGGAFIFSAYVITQYLLPVRSLTLRSGLSVLIGGILGNVTDRILYGYVIDFILVKNPFFNSPAFNMADLLQWVGYFLIVYAVLREGHLIWPEFNSRKKYWVNFKFQLKYCFVLMGVGFALSIISLVFSYTYMRVTVSEFVGNNPFVINKFVQPYIITYVIITITFSIALFSIGKLISHRIAGPLYAFERFLSELLEGKEATLKLRTGDEFRHLEELSLEIKKQLQQIRKERTIQVIEYDEKKPGA